MKSFGLPFFLADSKSWRSCLCSIFPAATLLCVVIFVGTAYLAPDYKEKLLRWQVADSFENPKLKECKNQCRPYGSEALPQGIVSKTSNLERRPLWDAQKIRRAKKKMVYQTIDSKANSSTNLFAMAVGIKQKDPVNKMVTKFLASDFVVMLFHYDGIVDEWKTFEWSDHVIHVSSNDQTKWWFAKRFLHPDIVAEYGYIFLWDEDLGVDYFHPKRYLSIITREGLEISQPALDGNKSEVHHQITARGRRSTVHRFSCSLMLLSMLLLLVSVNNSLFPA